MSGASFWTDGDVLEVVFRFEAFGQSLSQIAAMTGVSRSAIGGVVHRITRAADQVEARRLRDHEAVDLLSRFFGEDQSAERLAKRFGLSRNAVVRFIASVMVEAARAGAEDCARVENRDRVVWPDWWRVAPAKGVAA